ncbi:HAD domain-containing protein [Streptomyces sp. NPDC059788]|uniref:HAD domain-containing protein n=1 Tax=Streptomyces sp. NPDC059788 TaxID=3346948 RepID=UPI003669965B
MAASHPDTDPDSGSGSGPHSGPDSEPAPASGLPTHRPLLFLGIDGVLNPVLPTAGFTAHSLLDFTVLLSVDHVDWLRELSDTYDLVWATTWEHDANTHIAPLLELPRLPVVEFTGPRGHPESRGAAGHDGAPGRIWPRLLRYAGRRPFAWVDDVIAESLLHLSRGRPDRLLIPVDPGRGLLRGHVDRLLAAPPWSAPSPTPA